MIHLQNIKSQVLLGPTTAATTTRSASFDWTGADYATIRVVQSASAGTNGGCSISLLHADSVPTQATQFATFTADLTAQATTSHEAVYHVNLKNKKAYGKVILTPTTNTNDSIITMATLELSRLEQTPSNTSGMVSTTNDVVTLVN
jgi:hypothetical protein